MVVKTKFSSRQNNSHHHCVLQYDLSETFQKLMYVFSIFWKFANTVKLGIEELLNKEQIGFKELFTDDQLAYMYHNSTIK